MVRRDDAVAIAECRDEVAIRVRRAWESVQQHKAEPGESLSGSPDAMSKEPLPWIERIHNIELGVRIMPRGDKSAYTGKQKRKARHIEEGYRRKGLTESEAERRAWATVNKESGGGNKSGSGRGVPDTKVSSRKGGRLGGRASASRPAAARSASARTAAATRRRRKTKR